MPGIQDFNRLLCSGTITYSVDGVTQTGIIAFPCGMQHSTRVAGGGFQLPFRYQIYRERARLAPCCYWRKTSETVDDLDPRVPDKTLSGEPYVFEFVNITVPSGSLPDITITGLDGSTETVLSDPDVDVVGGWAHETSPSFFLVPNTLQTLLTSGTSSVPTLCQKADATIWNQGLDSTPPCNGAKTECPFYTGPKFQFINDENMAPGQPVKGQMIQELRSLLLNWRRYNEPQIRWEESFEEPYIWARDFDDVPQAIQVARGTQGLEEIPVYTILSRIYWDVLNEQASVAKYPSEDTGSEREDTDRKNPPKFPTIIRELGFNNPPSVEIVFPRTESNPTSQVQGDLAPFLYEAFEYDHNVLYLAGRAVPVANVYVVNRAFFPNFPDLTRQDLDPDQVYDFISSALIQESSLGLLPGFRATKSNDSRFWQLTGGIDLKPGSNFIFSLINVEGVWEFDFREITYIFHHCDVVQTSYTANLEFPQTVDLVARISTLSTNAPITFSLINFIGDLSFSSSYHFFKLDRSLTRFLKNLDTPKDSRFWKVVREEYTVQGSQFSGGLKWYRLNDCNQYVVEITSPQLPVAIPAGLDRSWEPLKITFSIAEEPGTSSHGAQQSTDLVMEVVEVGLGRSLDGKILPTRFLIVEPAGTQDIRHPEPSSVMTVELEVYKAVDVSAEGEDVLPELLSQYPDENSYSAGGVPVSQPLADDSLEQTPHQRVFSNSSLEVTGANRYDMSYFIEFVSNITGVVIGRKWVYGVAERSNTWARDIDIFYSWFSNQSFDKLLPDYNKAIVTAGGDQETSQDAFGERFTGFYTNQKETTYFPRCGDHDVSFGQPGPMFAPYEDCDQPRTQITSLGLLINAKISYADPVDEKYRGPDLQYPVIYKHNVFGTLFSKCWFEYSTGTFSRSQALWSGYARVRGPISINFNPLKYLRYKALSFTFPKFGNIGRDQVRVFKTMHYREFVYISEGGVPTVGLGWLPAFPYIGSSTLFDTSKPRVNLEQSVNVLSAAATSGSPDPENFASAAFIESLSTSTSVPTQLGSVQAESFFFERKSFDDVYEVKKIRTPDGQGVRWPDKGFYFNFRDPNVVWAHPEPYIEAVRDTTNLITNPLEVSEFITGVVIKLPKSDNHPDPETDKYSRTIHLGPEEGTYTVNIDDVKYDELGNVLEYASIYVLPSAKLYFDRFTGEILDKKNDLGSTPDQIYTATDLPTLQATLDLLGVSLDITPKFRFINLTEEADAPTTITGAEEYFSDSNLYTNLDNFYIYPLEGPEGVLDNDSEWKGFLQGFKVENIHPYNMPKKVLDFSADDFEFVGILPYIKFSSYPTTEGSLREGLSNTPLKEGGEYVTLFTPDGEVNYEFEWKPYVGNDFTVTGSPDPDPRKGYLGPVHLECSFTNPIEVAYLELKYQIYAETDTDQVEVTAQSGVPPEYDPAFSVKFISPEAEEYVLVDKAELRLVKYKKLTLDRHFVFSDLGDPGSTPIARQVVSKIVINVGPRRKENTGFKLSNLKLKVLKLNNSVTELVKVLEPKMMITTGYYSDAENGTREWAQDPNKLLGTVGASDISDILEQAGIAEFWRPGNLDLDDTSTQGKLRKHWAGKFLTWDTDPSSSEVLFRDLDVDTSESRQRRVLDAILTKLRGQFSYVKETTQKYFVSPYDRGLLGKLFGTTILEDLAGSLSIEYTQTEFDPNNLTSPSKGSESPGWQDAGFYACLDPETRIAACTNLGRRQSMVAYRGDHGVCKGGGDGTVGLLHPLLALSQVRRPGALAGVDPLSPSIQQQDDPNGLSERARRNANSESATSATEGFKRRRRFNP